MKRLPILLLLVLLPHGGVAAEKGTQFWNLATRTVTRLQLAPAGTGSFGPDQTRNDPDGTVDPDERLKITGVETGSYDVRIAFKGGQTCVVNAVAIERGKIFSIDNKALAACTQ